MPSISYNGQSFAIDGRRIWILGASIEYARVASGSWESMIAAARQAGFNTIETGCPWLVHEPRKGRFNFGGEANLRRFIELCGAAGMRVILRVGPYIGAQFDGGGLPGWIIEMPGIQLRQNHPVFLEHFGRYFAKLMAEVSDLQATTGGPIVLVQSEHAWMCSNDQQADTYLHELTRLIREHGIAVPIINSNDLWQEAPGTIDTWSGYDHLLLHLRQLRTVQPVAPRLVSSFEAAEVQTWGASGNGQPRRRSAPAAKAEQKNSVAVLRRLAEILAAGAQPIVTPFHAGTNFDFLGGRVPGRQFGFVTTAGFIDPPLGEAGTRGSKYHTIRRLITFANHFSHVFAELDPDYQPIVLDPESMTPADPVPGQRCMASVVPLRGAQGRIVFVFGDDSTEGMGTATLVLDDGIRLPVHLGDQPVGWFALDADLQGVGRLDYSNICPWGMIDRSIVVFHGPAGAPVFISISGTPLEATVPGPPHDRKPLVLEHKGLTVVICNQAQIDATYHDDSAVYVGIDGFDHQGAPIRHERFAKAYVIRRQGSIEELHWPETKRDRRGTPATSRHAPALRDWQMAPATAHVTGESPRYASLDGPETLSECGAATGYGWYRLQMKNGGRFQCHAPHAGDRVHLFTEGKRQHLLGIGPNASRGPFDLRIAKGGTADQTIVALVDNLGRFSEGNDLGVCKGLWGHLYEVKPLRVPKPKMQAAEPVNPFSLRGFIALRDATQLSDTWQVIWTIAHTRKTSLLIDVDGASCSGTFVLNDKPLAYYAGSTGGCLLRILIDVKTNKAMKRGKNVLRFAPDLRQENAVAEITKATTLYECVDALTENAEWAFAKWEPPPVSAYAPADKSLLRQVRDLPCWWRSTFELDELPAHGAHWLDTAGMSKGQAYINGENLGRYFTATGDGKAVGPQTRLYIPPSWLKVGQRNEVVLFDEHGHDPSRVRIVGEPDRQ